MTRKGEGGRRWDKVERESEREGGREGDDGEDGGRGGGGERERENNRG